MSSMTKLGTSIPICVDCKHMRGCTEEAGLLCDAFPEGIPDEILLCKFDHHKPYRGDHGIQFEPID